MLDSKKTNNSALFRMALVAAAVILAAAVIVIGIAKAAKKPADDTSQEQSTVITESPVPSAASEPTREPTVAPAPVDFSVWKSVNDEIYGWLEIPDTNISYPVVQSATSDEYYLRRHYDGTSNTYGTIFSQGTYNNTGFTDRVTMLYGHDVWNEDLYFHQLHKFSDDTFLMNTRRCTPIHRRSVRPGAYWQGLLWTTGTSCIPSMILLMQAMLQTLWSWCKKVRKAGSRQMSIKRQMKTVAT